VSASWIQLAPKEKEGSLREAVRSLKQRVSLTDQDERERIRNNYRNALKARSRSVNVEEWYKNWVITRLEGEDAEIPEVEGKSAVLDFFDATETFLPTLAHTERMIYQRVKQENQQQTLEEIGVLFI
jgi:hypothetical protein